ncbi:hypothetical protein KU6B_13830 [Mameliella alba]|nr:hypothetical protein KU6B_13830 [Mameliella alba]
MQCFNAALRSQAEAPPVRGNAEQEGCSMKTTLAASALALMRTAATAQDLATTLPDAVRLVAPR